MTLRTSQSLEWIGNQKRFKHREINKELVTGRANIRRNKNQVTLSIGITICELLDFKRNTCVDILIHNQDKNILLIRKAEDKENSYSLRQHDLSKNGRFKTVCFYHLSELNFRLSHTISLEFEIMSNKTLIVNIDKLKWSN